jgi:hypothetical protein
MAQVRKIISARCLLDRIHAGQADAQLRNDLMHFLKRVAAVERTRESIALMARAQRSQRKREAVAKAIQELRAQRPQLSERELVALIRRRTKTSAKLIRDALKTQN